MLTVVICPKQRSDLKLNECIVFYRLKLPEIFPVLSLHQPFRFTSAQLSELLESNILGGHRNGRSKRVKAR